MFRVAARIAGCPGAPSTLRPRLARAMLAGALLSGGAGALACGGLAAPAAPPDGSMDGGGASVDAGGAPADSAVPDSSLDATLVAPDAGLIVPDASLFHPDAGLASPDGAPYCGPASALVPGGCGDPSTDPHNCGGCGIDCDGGACDDGGCVPLPPGELATAQYAPYGIAVDAENVYWLDLGYQVTEPHAPPTYEAGQVLRCALGGCGNRPTVLATLPQGNIGYGTPVPSVLTLGNDQVVWAQSTGIAACDTGGCGCTPTVVYGGASGVGATVAGGTAYFTEWDPTALMGCPLTGCGASPAVLWSGIALGVTHDDANVYFTSNSGIYDYAIGPTDAGATPTHLWSGTGFEANTAGIAVDATHLYWTNAQPGPYGSVLECDKGDCGGTVVTLATGRSEPRGIAADAANVYWAESAGVVRCAIGGCANAPTVVVGAPSVAVALDATHVYFATEPGGATGTDAWIGVAAKP